MKRRFKSVQVILCVGLFMFVACRSTRSPQGEISNNKELVETSDKCEQKVKYYIDKIKGVRDGQEVSANTELVIDPAAKLITLTSEPPNQGKVSFDIQIESFDCNLNTNLTDGQSTYKGYIKQTDGTTTSSNLKIEAKDGELTITGGDQAQPEKMVMRVTKWEVFNE
jgi:hypothetical protein